MLLSALKVGLMAAASVGATLAVTGAGNFQGPNVVGLQFPLGSGGLKVAPDPSNIFSWDASGIPLTPPGSPQDHTVCIDVDGNGVADQLQAGLSVLITDCSSRRNLIVGRRRLIAIAPAGTEVELWDSTTVVDVGGGLYSPTTPIAVPSGSQLVMRLDFAGTTSPATLDAVDFRIHGRVVSH